MAIIRSIFAGISGLRSHQTFMDIIGNNIANVNTIGFKTGRVTFQESFAQTLRTAQRPGANFGGVNAQQLGLGVKISSLDTLFSQGALQTTDQLTDLAIQGDGFFIINDGLNDSYTRAGSFTFDANGALVTRNTGSRVQGKLADSTGNIAVDTQVGDIAFPFGRKLPAKATTEVIFTGNLDAGAIPDGNILETGKLFAVELAGTGDGANSDLRGLLARNTTTGLTTTIDGLLPNSGTVTISDGLDSDGDGTVETFSFTFVATDTPVDSTFNSLDDLIEGINNTFASRGTISAAFNGTGDGSIVFTRTDATQALVITSSNSNLQRALGTANLAVDDVSLTGVTNQFSHQVKTTDLLTNLRDLNGVDLGLQDTDGITLNANTGASGGTAVTQGTLTVDATSKISDFLTTIAATFGVTSNAGSVALTDTGRIRISAPGGTINEISSVSIVGAAADGTARAVFNGNIFDSTAGHYISTQNASDVQASAAATVFDSLGQRHVITLTFTKDVTSTAKWDFVIDVNDPAIIGTDGRTGSVTFKTDGSLDSFTHDQGATVVTFDPNSGAVSPVTIKIDPGIIGGFAGITQLGTNSFLVSSSQNGFGLGELESITINFKGEMVGSFSNGVSQQLAELALATFNNPGGLVRSGEGSFQQSANSGTPIVGKATVDFAAQITPGALEESNVDLAAEFTNMIVAQRGFQASARVITVSDQFLTELVNLKT